MWQQDADDGDETLKADVDMTYTGIKSLNKQTRLGMQQRQWCQYYQESKNNKRAEED